ncbi:hypothetical protein KP509_08G045500 [Ceratopteris richardii]|uniref:Uncharacterized protein n=1 Tax=Ceratopteris richardii TaxID=49495 RepID=A0A8T2U9K0_CERRI|nr:hypothetical protein KP509_08G045500 [Ceratopteris richardii]
MSDVSSWLGVYWVLQQLLHQARSINVAYMDTTYWLSHASSLGGSTKSARSINVAYMDTTYWLSYASRLGGSTKVTAAFYHLVRVHHTFEDCFPTRKIVLVPNPSHSNKGMPRSPILASLSYGPKGRSYK